MNSAKEEFERLCDLYQAGLYNPDDDPDLEARCDDPTIHEHPEVTEEDLREIFEAPRRPVTLHIEIDLRRCSPRCHYVYVLIDPESALIRYVGMTNKPFSRIVEHVSGESVYNPRLAAWLRELDERNLAPQMRIVHSVPSLREAERLESQTIARYRPLGIFNIRD